MTEKFINDLIYTLEYMDGSKHVIFAFLFHLWYYDTLCTLHGIPGI